MLKREYKMAKTKYLTVSKIKNKHIRRIVVILTLPFMIVLNCVFITISAIKQMVVTNVKTVKSAIEQGV